MVLASLSDCGVCGAMVSDFYLLVVCFLEWCLCKLNKVGVMVCMCGCVTRSCGGV